MKVIVSDMSRRGQRAENQDAVGRFVGAAGACLVVCDGLGSYGGSGIASRICADKFVAAYAEAAAAGGKDLFTASIARRCLQTAERGLSYEKRKKPELGQSSTTLAAVLTNGRTAVLCHVGDTRIYRFSGGRIVYVTKDHSAAQQAIERERLTREAIASHPGQNKLTRSVGGEIPGEPDITVFTDISTRDKFLICTDGLWTTVSEREMESVIAYYDSPAASLKCLEQCVLGRLTPDHDNFSAIICGLLE